MFYIELIESCILSMLFTFKVAESIFSFSITDELKEGFFYAISSAGSSVGNPQLKTEPSLRPALAGVSIG